jgi:hypothetical protein
LNLKPLDVKVNRKTIMKLYTLSTFETQNYTTANWFFATSRERAIELVDESIEKCKHAKKALERAEEISKRYWDAEKLPVFETKIRILNERIEARRRKDGWISALNEDYIRVNEIKKEYEKERDKISKKLSSNYSWALLCKIRDHYYAFDRDELLYDSREDLIESIKEIDADKVLPLIQTDGD